MNIAKTLILVAIVLMPSLGMARDEPAPDMEMLEFLGGFETARGKPVDPLAFADATLKDSKKKQPAAPKKDTKRSRKPDRQEQKEHDNEK
jgi:hypothetical protein